MKTSISMREERSEMKHLEAHDLYRDLGNNYVFDISNEKRIMM
jgi:hypothetical protein